MNLNDEIYDKSYNGFYRGVIRKVMDLKNGIYKVRIYPFFCDVNDDDLPIALSNMTNRFCHISLKENDIVWCFFENGDLNYPIIFDLCNVKDKYPKGADGKKPDFYDNITSDSNIDEVNVSYNGEYNSVDSIDFDNIKIEIDKKNKQIVIYSDIFYIILSKDGNIHIKTKEMYIKNDKTGINIGNNIIKINNEGIKIKSNNNSEINLDSLLEIKNSMINMKADILLKLKNIFEILVNEIRAMIIIDGEGRQCTINFPAISTSIKLAEYEANVNGLFK